MMRRRTRRHLRASKRRVKNGGSRYRSNGGRVSKKVMAVPRSLMGGAIGGATSGFNFLAKGSFGAVYSKPIFLDRVLDATIPNFDPTDEFDFSVVSNHVTKVMFDEESADEEFNIVKNIFDRVKDTVPNYADYLLVDKYVYGDIMLDWHIGSGPSAQRYELYDVDDNIIDIRKNNSLIRELKDGSGLCILMPNGGYSLSDDNFFLVNKRNKDKNSTADPHFAQTAIASTPKLLTAIPPNDDEDKILYKLKKFIKRMKDLFNNGIIPLNERAKILHMDLKPQNVVAREVPSVKRPGYTDFDIRIIDWGFAISDEEYHTTKKDELYNGTVRGFTMFNQPFSQSFFFDGEHSLCRANSSSWRYYTNQTNNPKMRMMYNADETPFLPQEFNPAFSHTCLRDKLNSVGYRNRNQVTNTEESLMKMKDDLLNDPAFAFAVMHDYDSVTNNGRYQQDHYNCIKTDMLLAFSVVEGRRISSKDIHRIMGNYFLKVASNYLVIDRGVFMFDYGAYKRDFDKNADAWGFVLCMSKLVNVGHLTHIVSPIVKNAIVKRYAEMFTHMFDEGAIRIDYDFLNSKMHHMKEIIKDYRIQRGYKKPKPALVGSVNPIVGDKRRRMNIMSPIAEVRTPTPTPPSSSSTPASSSSASSSTPTPRIERLRSIENRDDINRNINDVWSNMESNMSGNNSSSVSGSTDSTSPTSSDGSGSGSGSGLGSGPSSLNGGLKKRSNMPKTLKRTTVRRNAKKYTRKVHKKKMTTRDRLIMDSLNEKLDYSDKTEFINNTDFSQYRET